MSTPHNDPASRDAPLGAFYIYACIISFVGFASYYCYFLPAYMSLYTLVIFYPKYRSPYARSDREQ
jgi:hypothetical protein